MSVQNDGLAVLVTGLSKHSKEWRAARRAEAMAIVCPTCSALPLIVCTNNKGQQAAVIHVRRYDKKNFLKLDEPTSGLQIGMPW